MLAARNLGLCLPRLAGARALSSASVEDVVIVRRSRTPVGSIGGALASFSGPSLATAAIKGLLKDTGIKGEDIDEAILGNVISAGAGQAPTRQAVLGAGLPLHIPCTTINKVCASGTKSVMMAAQSIALGHNSVVLAGGFESMSNVPYYLPNARFGMRYGHGKVEDGLIKDGLWDVYNDFHMGMCAEKCVKDFGFTREQQDDFAIASYKKAAQAWEENRFADEVVPVEVPQRKGDPKLVSVDEEFSKVNMDKLKTLAPAFDRKTGSVTAANASSLNDGAAALLLMSASRAKELGMTPLARIRGFGDAATAPEDFTVAPAKAVPVALERAGVSGSDVEYHEINEAFAAVVLANMQLLDIDPSRVNVNGGAVALGHPIGMSGARIVGSLITVLQQQDATLGVASICNGGGGASAIVIERM